jgi:hypothetical protein
MNNRYALTSISLLLAAGPALFGQVSTGALTGRVVDSAGKSVPGARIALESSALFQTKVITADANGQYRAQLLPVGNYVIKVSATGYLGKTAENVRVGLGANVSMDFSLKAIKDQGATVEVVASVAMEAKTDDKISVNYSSEELLKLPTERSFDGAMALSPGVTGSGLNASIRGGSNSGATHNGMVGYNQVAYTIDGIDVKQDAGSQWDSNGTNPKSTLFDPLPDSIEDVQVVQSQLNARFGRSEGGAVNILTKTGSNNWEGSLRSYINRPSWTTNIPKGLAGGDLTNSESNANEGYSRYTDVTLSGPIVKDRVWFFFGTRIQPSSSSTARLGWGLGATMQHFDGTNWNDLPGDWQQYMNSPLTTYGKYSRVDDVLTGKGGYPMGFGHPNLATSDNNSPIPANSTYKRYQAKITGQINEGNSLSATYLFSKNDQGGVTGERTAPPSTTILSAFAGSTAEKTTAYTLNWNSTLAANWFLEAKVSRAEVKTEDVAGPQTYPYFVQSTLGTGDINTQLYASNDGQAQNNGLPRTGYFGVFYTLRSSASITPNVVGNMSYSANFKTFQELKGQHEIDFGGDFFQTEHQFGRERNGNFGVFEGGFIRDPSKSWYDQAGFLFPTFYSNDPTDSLVIGDGAPESNLVQGSEIMRGPSAHIEQYNVKGAKAKNNATAIWLNDTWTINEQWNVMVGLRYNKFVLKDTDGTVRADNSIVEPRFQVKFNPDGKGKEIFTLTAAKLASKYSDDFASWFRTNGWTSRVVRSWNGAAYNTANPGNPQLAVQDAGADPLAGVRWVTYADLTNLGNYNPVPQAVVALDQVMNTSGLNVPYALEFTLSDQRNYDTGYVRLSLVKRLYKKDWVANVVPGLSDPTKASKYLTLVKNPVNGQPFNYQQTLYFINSDQNRDYTDVELAWNQNITPRLSFGGSYTYAVEHGLTNNGSDYYNYRDDKLAMGGDPQSWGPTNALLNKSQVLTAYLTYTMPIGKGNVSASVLGKYYTNGVRSLVAATATDWALPSSAAAVGLADYPIMQPNAGIYQVPGEPSYNRYYGAPGSYTSGSDVYTIDCKLQAEFPLAGRLMLTAYVQVNNLFNRILSTGSYDWGSSGELGKDGNGIANSPVPGRALASFNMPWGYKGDNSYYNTSSGSYGLGRTFTQFAIGLKF